jgi:hypothetical protein
MKNSIKTAIAGGVALTALVIGGLSNGTLGHIFNEGASAPSSISQTVSQHASGNTMTAILAAQTALKVGDHLKDGTIIIHIDNNTALTAPENLFGGVSDFRHQDDVVAQANAQNLQGHNDWRRATDEEASILAKNWNKVAPPAQQGSAAPQFWGKYAEVDSSGRVYRGGETDPDARFWSYSLSVPVVRSVALAPR